MNSFKLLEILEQDVANNIFMTSSIRSVLGSDRVDLSNKQHYFPNHTLSPKSLLILLCCCLILRNLLLVYLFERNYSISTDSGEFFCFSCMCPNALYKNGYLCTWHSYSLEGLTVDGPQVFHIIIFQKTADLIFAEILKTTYQEILFSPI